MQDKIKIRESETFVVLDLPEHMVKTGQDVYLRTKLLDVIEKQKNVAVNLSKTAFINSGIVTVFLAAEKLVQKYGKRLFLIHPSEQAMELFTVTSVNRIITILDNEKDIPA